MKNIRIASKLLLISVLTTACTVGPDLSGVFTGGGGQSGHQQCYLRSLSDTRGVNLTLVRNSSNQIAQIMPGGGGPPTTFNYDSKGNISSVTSGLSTTVFTYDGNNLLVSSSKGAGASASTTTYTRNSSGQVISEAYSFFGFSETYTFTYPNTTTRNYTTITRGTEVTTFEYDSKMTPTSAYIALQFLLTENLPITDNNFTKRSSTSGGVTNIITYSYQYNENGYPTTQTTTFPGTPNQQVVTYTYNCK